MNDTSLPGLDYLIDNLAAGTISMQAAKVFAKEYQNKNSEIPVGSEEPMGTRLSRLETLKNSARFLRDAGEETAAKLIDGQIESLKSGIQDVLSRDPHTDSHYQPGIFGVLRLDQSVSSWLFDVIHYAAERALTDEPAQLIFNSEGVAFVISVMGGGPDAEGSTAPGV